MWGGNGEGRGGGGGGGVFQVSCVVAKVTCSMQLAPLLPRTAHDASQIPQQSAKGLGLDHDCHFMCIVRGYNWSFHIFYAALETSNRFRCADK